MSASFRLVFALLAFARGPAGADHARVRGRSSTAETS
jgi:hypothetical protein